jgi:hypothetical protein
VTGSLTSSLYDPNCTFKDPTTNVKGTTQHTCYCLDGGPRMSACIQHLIVFALSLL